jgi:hypothetical protein
MQMGNSILLWDACQSCDGDVIIMLHGEVLPVTKPWPGITASEDSHEIQAV